MTPVHIGDTKLFYAGTSVGFRCFSHRAGRVNEEKLHYDHTSTVVKWIFSFLRWFKIITFDNLCKTGLYEEKT